VSQMIVFAPSREGDDALRCTRWIADVHLARANALQLPVHAILDGAAVRGALEQAASSTRVDGLILLGHGQEGSFVPLLDDAMMGADGLPALDRDNVGLTTGRWVHTLACRSGTELAGIAVHAGATCFAGYDVALLVDWIPEELDDLGDSFARLVTATSFLLQAGMVDERAIKRDISDLADSVFVACDASCSREAANIRITAGQLVDRLVIRVRDQRVDEQP